MPEYFYNMDVTQSLNNLREVEFENSAEATDLIATLMHSARSDDEGYASLRYAGQLLGLPNRNDTSLFGWTEEDLALMVIQKLSHHRAWKILWPVPKPIPAVPAHPINTFEDEEPLTVNRKHLLEKARDIVGFYDMTRENDRAVGVIELVAGAFGMSVEEARDKILSTPTQQHPIDPLAERLQEMRRELFEMYPDMVKMIFTRDLPIQRVPEPRHQDLNTPEVLPSSTDDEMDPPQEGVYTLNLEAIITRGAQFYKAETYGDHDVMQNYGIEKLIEALTGEDPDDIRDALVERAIKL